MDFMSPTWAAFALFYVVLLIIVSVLDLVNGVGDLNFEGEIVGYSTKPMAIQGNETADRD